MNPEVEQHTGSRRRSRAGCWTCRNPTVKKGCDRKRPICGRCERLKSPCDYSARPTLKERRKTSQSTNSVLKPSSSSARVTSPVVAETQSASLSLSHLTVAVPHTISHALVFVKDQEAVQYFRTEFARIHHTKNPAYSLISLMFNLARDEPMVMHMVVAIGHQEMDFRRPQSAADVQQVSSYHYSLALRLMADAIAPPSETTKHLDIILTTLWLMLLYEQQFGDERCRAYLNHLQGVSSLLQSQSGRLLQLPPYKLGARGKISGALRTTDSSGDSNISIYSARVLIWIVLLGSAAATSGVGGHVNEAILNMLLSNPTYSSMRPTDPIKAFARLHHYSNSLYRLAWGDAYPQAELVDDVENRNVYALLGHCAYLRFLTAQLATAYREDPVSAANQAIEVEYSIDEVGDLFRELMEVAHELNLETDNSHRLIANLRTIVPMYYAIILDFLRLTNFDGPMGERQRYALQEIMNLCYQDFIHSDTQPNLRVAWPLFMAALETQDMLHHNFILKQFEDFRLYGKNYERAHRFLRDVIEMQRRNGKHIDFRKQMEHMELFVLG